MEETAILYVVKNKVNSKRYFGITFGRHKSIERRFKQHISGDGGKHLYEAMLELGPENFWIEAIKEGPLEYIRELETRMIRRYSHIKDSKGYNGCISKAIVISQDGLKRMAAKLRGRKKWAAI